MQVLYPQANDLNTYSSLFSLLHCGRTSASFRTTSFSQLFHDKLNKNMQHPQDRKVNVSYDEKQTSIIINHCQTYLMSSIEVQCLRQDATLTKSEVPMEVKLQDKDLYKTIRQLNNCHVLTCWGIYISYGTPNYKETTNCEVFIYFMKHIQERVYGILLQFFQCLHADQSLTDT